MDIDPDANHTLVENSLPMGVRAVQIGISELCVYFKKNIKLRGGYIALGGVMERSGGCIGSKYIACMSEILKNNKIH